MKTKTYTVTGYALWGDIEPYISDPLDVNSVASVANELEALGTPSLEALRLDVAEGDAFATAEDNEIIEVTITVTVAPAQSS